MIFFFFPDPFIPYLTEKHAVHITEHAISVDLKWASITLYSSCDCFIFGNVMKLFTIEQLQLAY